MVMTDNFKGTLVYVVCGSYHYAGDNIQTAQVFLSEDDAYEYGAMICSKGIADEFRVEEFYVR
jgi:hypothetical protein